MKKLFAAILAAALLLAIAATSFAAGGNPWPEMELDGIETALSPLGSDSQRHQSYFGPSKNYPGDGAYKPKKATRVRALFREDNFVLVDLTYETVGRRILYFRSGSLKNSNVENVSLRGYPAHTTGQVAPLQGPGTQYDNVLQTTDKDLSHFYFTEITAYDYDTDSWVTYQGWFDAENWVFYTELQKDRHTIYLKENTRLSVFFETDGWVYAEFSCTLGTIRAWIPAACVEAD